MTEPLTERLQQAVDAARQAVDAEVLVLELSTGEHKHRPFIDALTRYGDLRALQGAWEHRQRDPLNGVDTRHQTSAMHDDTCPACKLEVKIEAALKGADDGSA